MAEGKEKSGFILWNLNPSHVLYLKYIPNIPYSHKNEFSIIKGEEGAGGRGKGNKAYLPGG